VPPALDEAVEAALRGVNLLAGGTGDKLTSAYSGACTRLHSCCP
jgi:hypothetical protein